MKSRQGMSGSEGDKIRTRKGISKLARHFFMGGALLMMSFVPPAEARDAFTPEDRDPLTADLTFSASTNKAGANPDLTIEMHRMRNHCPNWLDDPNTPPGGPVWNKCFRDDIYMEPDLKKVAVSLPPGLVADANAAPYCDAFRDFNEGEEWVWQCKNPDSVVGEVSMILAGCSPTIPGMNGETVSCINTGVTYRIPGAWADEPGAVYNERPGPGEQGHLVVFWPGLANNPDRFVNMTRADISIRVRKSDTGIDSIADDIPAYVETWLNDALIGGDGEPFLINRSASQISDMVMTLYGSRGKKRGHPLLTNPTFCDPQTIDVEFQGYINNSVDYPPDNLPDPVDPHLPSGEGEVVPASAIYQVTGCPGIPYDPKLSMSFDSTAPEGVPAISSTVTQEPGEATTDSVEVKFPSSYKINVDNKAEHCSEEALKATEDDPEKDHCPESSKIGTVTAESRLLPIGEKLEGNVYLAGLTSDSIKISTFLRGFIDLRIDAEGKVEEDLTVTTTLKDLPATPVSRFDLKLVGGKDKGLLKNPRICKKHGEITADFQSHSGKVKRNTVPVEIKGCSDPTLDVELSNRRKGELTDIDLSIGSPGTAVKAVEIRMPRQLHWGYRKRLSPRVARESRAVKRTKKKRTKKIKRLKSAGTITFLTASGERRVRFKAKRTKRGNLGFAPFIRKTKEGQIIAAQVPGFSASLFRTIRRQSAATGAENAKEARKGKRERKGTNRKKTKRKRARRQTDLALTGLPGEDLTAVELSLRGRDKRRKFFLRNPTGCRKPLNFVAIVTTTDGRKLALKDQVRLRGRGCGKRRR